MTAANPPSSHIDDIIGLIDKVLGPDDGGPVPNAFLVDPGPVTPPVTPRPCPRRRPPPRPPPAAPPPRPPPRGGGERAGLDGRRAGGAAPPPRRGGRGGGAGK